MIDYLVNGRVVFFSVLKRGLSGPLVVDENRGHSTHLTFPLVLNCFRGHHGQYNP